MLIDEAHHIMPPEWARAVTLPQQRQGTIYVTVHPEHVARAALESVGLVIAVGMDPAATLCSFCRAVGEDPPEMRAGHIDRGLAYFWERRERRLRRVPIFFLIGQESQQPQGPCRARHQAHNPTPHCRANSAMRQ